MKNLKSIFCLTKRTLSTFSSNSSYSLISFNLKTFSTIRLKTHTSLLEFPIKAESSDSNVKKTLSKNWVLPKHIIKHNKIAKDSNFSNDEAEKTLVTGIGKMTSVDFERFAVKTGLGMSNAETIYIQDIIYNQKKVRFVGEAPEDLARLNSLSEEQGTFEEPEVFLLVNNTETKEKRFVLYDKSRRIVLTNSQNKEVIRKVLDDLTA